MHTLRFANDVNHFGFHIELLSDGLYLRRYLPCPDGSTTEDLDWMIFLAPQSVLGYTKKQVQQLLDTIDPTNFIPIVWYTQKLFPYTTKEMLEIQQQLREELIESGIDPDTGKNLDV